MQLLDALILGVTQGLTEFIPVSSTGHLILVGHFLHFAYSGPVFDTALDVGTLLSLVIFFARDFLEIGRGLVMGGPKRPLGVYLVLATIPGVVAGMLLEHQVQTVFRDGRLVAFNLIWVGIVMFIVDRYSRMTFDISKVTLPRALTIGVAQALALVPGVSRSGTTITTARALGFNRGAAVRFSFLLSAPIILGGIVLVLAKSSTIAQMSGAPTVYVVGVVAALVCGYATIKFLLAYLSDHGLGVFAVYRIILGIFILQIGLR
jgi:undecaprenyl-diphosphatase